MGHSLLYSSLHKLFVFVFLFVHHHQFFFFLASFLLLIKLIKSRVENSCNEKKTVFKSLVAVSKGVLDCNRSNLSKAKKLGQ